MLCLKFDGKNIDRTTIKSEETGFIIYTLIEKKTLLSVSASLDGNACILAVEGLPILSIPLPSEINKHSPQSIRLAHNLNEGRASLMIEQPKGTSTYVIAGLDHLVPLSAGKLEVSSDAFHSSPSAGESVP